MYRLDWASLLAAMQLPGVLKDARARLAAAP